MPIDQKVLYTEVGKRLKQWRAESSLTQVQLAEASGILRTSITNIEAGRQRAPLHVLYDLCSVLGVEVAMILPTHAEMRAPSTVSVTIEGTIREVPPKTAEF